ncbi:type IV pilus twitching motility protein PilT [Inmirania thermothiophila]|uniref:Pilus retraction ATPase PilT n=1 Tax=Inmirania thermothiophila TaxID=1750597 RepID=A0A3N1Y4E6_9GAMM|nr:PilT/PilU family type 4a pilus ATPase [Inmirania thermothiophila]ROR32157.1 pilus retraction ATPase PilT [Inmirania thermothiophila]
MSRIDAFLRLGREQGCSDVHLAVGAPPLLRLHGQLEPVKYRELGSDELAALLDEILDPDQRRRLAAGDDLDFAYHSEEAGRFRVNVYRTVAGLAAAFRVIPSEIPRLEALGLPEVVRRIPDLHQGLVLVTGATGSGKSTTLAALIDHINRHRRLNIITLEDPIEFVHRSERSLVVQREVGTHVPSFAEGLRAALREDPDIILVGEMRDTETITLAMTAADTGHLVLGTLHTSTAAKTLDRIIDALPPEQKLQGMSALAQNLRYVISQTLVRTPDGRGRRAVAEVMVMTPAIAHLLMAGKVHQIPSQIQMGRAQGMQLLDQALLAALQAKEIDPDEAYLHATDKKLFQRFVTDPALLPTVSLGGG